MTAADRVGRGLVAWRWLVGGWPAMTAASIAASLALAPHPLTWRRPARDEFWRFAAIAGPGSLGAMVLAAVLVGIGLVGQGIVWLDQVAQADTFRHTIMVVLVREVTPVVVGLVSLGRAGLLNLAELGAMRADGTVRALEAQGLDPFMLFVLPRVLALGLCILAHAVVFLAVAVLAGYLFAQLLGVATQDIFGLVRFTLRTLGEVGLLALPLKTLLIGFAIAGVTAVTALRWTAVGGQRAALSLGFFRALVAIFVVSLMGSLVL